MPNKNVHLSEGQLKIQDARHHDPFSVLGLHRQGDLYSICVFAPQTRQLSLPLHHITLERIEGSDFFCWQGRTSIATPYQLQRVDTQGHSHLYHDPYSLPAQLSDFDMHLFGEGRHWHVYRILGAHLHQIAGVHGVLFATWAPNAERVSVVGDFNNWDGCSMLIGLRRWALGLIDPFWWLFQETCAIARFRSPASTPCRAV